MRRPGSNEKHKTVVMKPVASPDRDENDERSVCPFTVLSPHPCSLIARHPGNLQAGIHPERWPRQRFAENVRRMDSRQ